MRLSTCVIAMLLKPLPARDPKKTKSLPSSVGSARSSSMARSDKRHPVLLAALHASGRNHPSFVFEIDLVPLRADDLAGACGGEDREFQRPCGHAFALAQLRHEGRQLGVGHGGMVVDLRHLSARRQHLGQMAFPTRRIVAGAIAAHRAPNPARLRSGRAPGSWFRFWSSNAARSRAAPPACRSRLTAMLPSTGKAYCFNVLVNCARCLAFFHLPSC